MSPAVSVIVPTFNRLNFIAPAIESVLAQLFADWELIVADDGSDRETQAYLKTLDRAPRIRVMELPHTGSPALVRNAALLQARGEYVAFLDSDDLWLPGKLQTQMDSLRRHPERGWSCTGFVMVDASGAAGISPRTWDAPSGWVLDALLAERYAIHLSSVVIAKQLLDQLGAFDATLGWCTEEDLWYRLAAHSELDGINAPLTLVRRHTQHSGDDATALIDLRRVIEKTMTANADPKRARLLRRRRATVSAYLVRRHALNGSRSKAAQAAVASLGHSWRYRQWWFEVMAAMARAVAPRAAPAAARWLGL
jgi:glycosyltransferase involved in cell wall biosynthesis